MTTIHHSPPPGATPFAIYEDPEDQEPPSPSDEYGGETSFNSEVSLPGADEPVPSIEQEEQEALDQPEPYNSSYTSRPSILSTSQSRRTSGVTSTSFISSLPSEISISSKPAPLANYGVTPRKERPPFRNPSSVRAMQMSSPPPLPAFDNSRERTKPSYKLATPSRSGRSETPVSATRSRRSGSHRDAHAQQSPRPTPTPQQHLPLVLLHVTILPMQMPYPHDIMVKYLPEWLVENYKLLEEKLQGIVLMRRGLLIPHPRDEYDLLEERILESLELKTPRLLKCGHFVGPDVDVDDDKGDGEEDQGSVTDDGTGRGSRMSGGTITVEEEGEWKCSTPEIDDESVCTDCHRQVKKPGKGVGAGTRRWDIKIYAANGLMRAGAWSAAWSEMERCDVEISPWIPEDVRKDLEKKMIEEQEAEERKAMYAAELQRRAEEDAARQRKLAEEAEERRKVQEAELQRRVEAEAAALQRKLDEEAAEKKRLDDELHEKIEEAKEAIRLEFEAQALAESSSIAERFRAMEEALKEQSRPILQPVQMPDPRPVAHQMRNYSRGRPRSTSRRPHIDDIPLGILLKNYILLLLRDQRNLVILLLSSLVIFLLMNSNSNWNLHLASSSLASKLPEDPLPEFVSSMFVTTTTTATQTSISTLTVTQLPHDNAIRGTPVAQVATSIASILEAETSSAFKEISPASSWTSSIAESQELPTTTASTEVAPMSIKEASTVESSDGNPSDSESWPISSIAHALDGMSDLSAPEDTSAIVQSSPESVDVPAKSEASQEASQALDWKDVPSQSTSPVLNPLATAEALAQEAKQFPITLKEKAEL